MDGLDVYIDDYTKFEPMSAELVAQLNHAKFLFDPPKTRVNAQGHVEDVPVEPTRPSMRPLAAGDRSGRRRRDGGASKPPWRAVLPPNAPLTSPVPALARRGAVRIDAMTLPIQVALLCSCNGTAPIDAAGVAAALGLADAAGRAHELCQKQLAAFADGRRGDVIVGCTQEARLFAEIADDGATHADDPLRQHPRDRAAGRREARGATPKLAALLAQAALPDPDPVPSVSYRVRGSAAHRRSAASWRCAGRTRCRTGWR